MLEPDLTDMDAQTRIHRLNAHAQRRYFRIERLDWLFGTAIVAIVGAGLLLLNFVTATPPS